MRNPAFVTVFLLGVLAGSPARSETFVLNNGGRVEGELLNPGESPRKSYVVRTTLGKVTLNSSQVKLVRRRSEAEQWYDVTLPKMPNTLEANWKMAEMCRERNLPERRRVHLENVIAIDAEHAEARRGLGYSRVEGKWVLSDLWNRQQGLVRFQGDWLTPQEVYLQQASRAADLKVKEWRRTLRMWRSFIVKRRGKQLEGMQNFRQINDPLAAPALAALLKDEKNSELKLLFIDVLGRMKTMHGVNVFISLTLNDLDENVRDACYKQLVTFGSNEASIVYVSKAGLKSSDNKIVNRAAVGLARMKDRAAVPALVDALTTKHKFIMRTGGGGPGQLNPVFGSGPGGGLGGLNVGGKTKLVERDVQNPKVRSALTALAGNDLGYNKAAWKRWLVREHTPWGLDLRRGE